GDPVAHAERARAAGAEIVMELEAQDYGGSEYAALDPEGNVWSFGSYDPWAT
ncbi:MAG: glyoxalase, partial [Acidimicrobiia bacterium]|nr:glyoxalase [Acidimicrobiia bacterium]